MLKFVPKNFPYFNKKSFLDILFPQVCTICGKMDKNYLCDKCYKKIEKFKKDELIQGKVKIFLNNKFYKKDYIIKDIYFDELFYSFEYKGIIRKLLLKYKFYGSAYLSYMFANLLINNPKVKNILERYDIIIPVPMDKIKKIKRGYNQTELIINIFKSYSQILKNVSLKKFDYKDYIIKIKKSKTQSKLNFKQRQENIKNVFKVKNFNKLKNKNIIIFDDICTTGATVNEISRILKDIGVNRIIVLVIAKD